MEWDNVLKEKSLSIDKDFELVPTIGIEPTTPSLRVKCSTDRAKSAQNKSGSPLLL